MVIYFPNNFRFFKRSRGTFATLRLITSQRVTHKPFCQRSDFTMAMSRCYHHIFQVEADTVEGEVVAVTGSSGELGRWRRNSVVPLVRDSDNRWLHPRHKIHNHLSYWFLLHCGQEISQYVIFSNTWRLGVDLSGDEEHSYRYCVVVILNTEAQHSIISSEALGRQKKVIVRRWETHLVPRYVKLRYNTS